MTLQQLRYVTAIAETGTLSEAARRFYIAQPSLTASLRELEEELGLTIFRRTNRGAVLTPEGEEFLGYVRQVLAQVDLMEEKYLGAAPVKHQFCVSTQHYSFAVEAFVELLREYGGPEYDFRIRETQTYELIEDVALLRSEVGVLYLNKDNETVLRKVIREHDLQFTPLFTARPHVFVSASSPLAAKPAVTLDDLAPYPRLSYEQGEHNAFYFSEEILSTRDSKKDILVSDRATLFNLLIGLNGYTICSGVISESLNGPNIVAVPLLVDDAMQIGYLTHKQVQPGLFGKPPMVPSASAAKSAAKIILLSSITSSLNSSRTRTASPDRRCLLPPSCWPSFTARITAKTPTPFTPTMSSCCRTLRPPTARSSVTCTMQAAAASSSTTALGACSATPTIRPLSPRQASSWKTRPTSTCA